MKSKVTIFGHAIHPILISFPTAFYTSTFVLFICFRFSPNAFWFKMGYAANLAGIACALLAALVGLIDYFAAIPQRNAAKQTGLIHMILNIIALGLFSYNAWNLNGQWYSLIPNDSYAVTLSGLGLLFTFIAGFYGWTLVQKHHIGVDLTAEQTRLEPAQPQKFFSNTNKPKPAMR